MPGSNSPRRRGILAAARRGTMAPLCCWVAAAACAACALPMSTPAAAAGAAPLPRVRIDPAGVSVSGISSGADMVVQLQVAYSDVFAGVGVFAVSIDRWWCAGCDAWGRRGGRRAVERPTSLASKAVAPQPAAWRVGNHRVLAALVQSGVLLTAQRHWPCTRTARCARRDNRTTAPSTASLTTSSPQATQRSRTATGARPGKR